MKAIAFTAMILAGCAMPARAQQKPVSKAATPRKKIEPIPDFSVLTAFMDALLDLKGAVAAGVIRQDYQRKLQTATGESLKAEARLPDTPGSVRRCFELYNYVLFDYQTSIWKWDDLLWWQNHKSDSGGTISDRLRRVIESVDDLQREYRLLEQENTGIDSKQRRLETVQKESVSATEVSAARKDAIIIEDAKGKWLAAQRRLGQERLDIERHLHELLLSERQRQSQSGARIAKLQAQTYEQRLEALVGTLTDDESARGMAAVNEEIEEVKNTMADFQALAEADAKLKQISLPQSSTDNGGVQDRISMSEALLRQSWSEADHALDEARACTKAKLD